MFNKVTVYTPPSNIQKSNNEGKVDLKIFLAGTIDNGESKDWQQEVIEKIMNGGWNASAELKDNSNTLVANFTKHISIYNPRRDNWDKNLEQKFSTPQFYQQVNWELDALEKSDVIIMNIIPGSKSPISLMELGLFARSRKLKVICPEGFYRKGNVDVVCNKYNIPMYESIDEVIKSLKL